MDCCPPFGASRAYETLFSSPGIHHDDRAHMITFEIFAEVFYILGFDPTLYREDDEEHINLPRQGNVRLQAHF